MGFESYDRQECAKSATMYVLQHFQPRLEKKTTLEHYVKKTMIDLMPDEQPDLDKIISSEIEFIVDKVRFNADWFTTDAYLKLWKRYFTEFLDENTTIQEAPGAPIKFGQYQRAVRLDDELVERTAADAQGFI